MGNDRDNFHNYVVQIAESEKERRRFGRRNFSNQHLIMLARDPAGLSFDEAREDISRDSRGSMLLVVSGAAALWGGLGLLTVF